MSKSCIDNDFAAALVSGLGLRFEMFPCYFLLSFYPQIFRGPRTMIVPPLFFNHLPTQEQ